MMELDSTALNNRLESLSTRKQLAFLLFLCERMMPGLRKFGMDNGFDVSIYEYCLRIGWAWLEGTPVAANYEELSERCLNNAPDPEAFNHSLTSAALDAALSIGTMLSFLSDKKTDHVIEVAELARDTIALYVQQTNSNPPISLTVDCVMSHHLMQQELRQQAEILELLESHSRELDPILIDRVKERATYFPMLPSAPTK
jgi:uncharacterized protein